MALRHGIFSKIRTLLKLRIIWVESSFEKKILNGNVKQTVSSKGILYYGKYQLGNIWKASILPAHILPYFLQVPDRPARVGDLINLWPTSCTIPCCVRKYGELDGNNKGLARRLPRSTANCRYEVLLRRTAQIRTLYQRTGLLTLLLS